jgi:hypothetical protein
MFSLYSCYHSTPDVQGQRPECKDALECVDLVGVEAEPTLLSRSTERPKLLPSLPASAWRPAPWLALGRSWETRISSTAPSPLAGLLLLLGGGQRAAAEGW